MNYIPDSKNPFNKLIDILKIKDKEYKFFNITKLNDSRLSFFFFF